MFKKYLGTKQPSTIFHTNLYQQKLQIDGNKPNGAKTESDMALYGAKTEILFGTIWWYMHQKPNVYMYTYTLISKKILFLQ